MYRQLELPSVFCTFLHHPSILLHERDTNKKNKQAKEAFIVLTILTLFAFKTYSALISVSLQKSKVFAC